MIYRHVKVILVNAKDLQQGNDRAVVRTLQILRAKLPQGAPLKKTLKEGLYILKILFHRSFISLFKQKKSESLKHRMEQIWCTLTNQ